MNHAKTLGEKWHEESQALGAIEGVIAGLAVALAFIFFVTAGSCSHSEHVASAASVNEETQLEASDIPIPEHAVEPPNMGIRVNEGWEKAFEPEPEEPAYEEAYYYDETAYYGYSGNDYGNPFRSDGVAQDGYGRNYTWYSQNVLSGGGLTALNNNGRHVDESTGYVVDGDGYIAIAVPSSEIRSESNPNGYLAADENSGGDIIDTPWGQARIYDVNEGDAWDVYTDF